MKNLQIIPNQAKMFLKKMGKEEINNRREIYSKSF